MRSSEQGIWKPRLPICRWRLTDRQKEKAVAAEERFLRLKKKMGIIDLPKPRT